MHLYKFGARIEQTTGKLKRFKRVVMRCEKTDINYSAIISSGCALMLERIAEKLVVAIRTPLRRIRWGTPPRTGLPRGRRIAAVCRCGLPLSQDPGQAGCEADS